jgi:predicted TIM-barrel fold metal-dependent hydrolase
MSVAYSQNDRQVWTEELDAFIPSRLFDSHVHLFDRTCLRPETTFSGKSAYSRFGGAFTLLQYLEWADAWLPGRTLSVNAFGHPAAESDLDASAVYSGSIADNRRVYGMALVSPHDSLDSVKQRVNENRLVGYKPYLNFVDWKEPSDITLADMLPESQMQFADEAGLAITLHIPRPDRLADPVNQRQMVELCRRYPRVQVIFAHIGRAYYRRNVIGFLDGIARCPNAWLDTAMVNHEGVLEYAFTHFPRDRILFGSDAPIACLRGKSVEINNQYAYLMGEDYEIGTSIYDARHAVTFTSFFYEQLRGIKLAAERVGLSGSETDGIFFNNADRLFSAVARRYDGQRE